MEKWVNPRRRSTPPCPDRHLRVDHEDYLVEVHTACLVLGQKRRVFGSLGHAAPLERITPDRTGPSHHALGGLAHGLAQLLDGLLLGRGEVELYACTALK